jgi:hypothetical protein
MLKYSISFDKYQTEQGVSAADFYVFYNFLPPENPFFAE